MEKAGESTTKSDAAFSAMDALRWKVASRSSNVDTNWGLGQSQTLWQGKRGLVILNKYFDF
jgi:hypothetical protein